MKTLLILILSLCVQITHARTLLVSDIDDTIKQSFVLSKLGIVSNAKRISNDFYGMSELYQHLQQDIPGLEFVYLSNAPQILMSKPHAYFLKYNSFPVGELALRQKVSESEHKIKMLRRLMNTNKYSEAILVGDNGEKDASIYDQIAFEYPQIKFYTYIRQVYSVNSNKYTGAKLEVDQLGFVTPIDIIYDLAVKNIIDWNRAMNFTSHFIPLLISKPLDQNEESVTFPEWQNCADYQSSIANFPAARIESFQLFVQMRCR